MQTGQCSTAGTVDTQALFAQMSGWALADRRIGQRTLERMPVGPGTVFFPDAGKKLPAIFFGYREGWKARAIGEKHFVAGGGFKSAFWNLEAVLAGNAKTVYITEGELDALALVEAGLPADAVLSVPTGAKTKASEDGRGLEYAREALEQGLSRIKKFIWCGDGDGPGLVLRSDMVRVLGAARFNFVDWPEGVKDANDFLKTDGAQSLYDLAVHGSLPWPVDGLFRMSELPEPPPLSTWEPGIPEWEKKVLLAPRTLAVTTGHPGHGKTEMMAQIYFNICRRYDVVAAVASFETGPRPHLRRKFRSLHSFKLEKEMSQEEVTKADAWIQDHYLFMRHPDTRPSLEWLLDMAEVAVIRHGARIVLLDPWNRMESQFDSRAETKTEYILRCLKTLYSFAQDMNTHVMVLAHPAKMDSRRRGAPPDLEDISDSKHWDNIVDQGFVIHRPVLFEDGIRKTEADFFCKKARFEELGYPCKLQMRYDLQRAKFVSRDYE